MILVLSREDIGRLSRIVTLNNISIVSNAQSKDGSLVLDAVTKTFRYLDEEELAAKKEGGPSGQGWKEMKKIFLTLVIVFCLAAPRKNTTICGSGWPKHQKISRVEFSATQGQTL